MLILMLIHTDVTLISYKFNLNLIEKKKIERCILFFAFCSIN